MTLATDWLFAVPVNRNAEGGHIGEHIAKFNDSTPLRVIGCENGHIGLVFKCSGGESGQNSLRAALNERSYTEIVHVFQLFYKFNRAGYLLHENVINALLVIRIEIRRDIGKNRQ